LPPYYETAAVLLLIFHEVVYFGDEASITRARERMKAKAGDKVFHKLLNMKNPAFLPYRAAKLAFLDDDPAQARELIAQARTSLPTLQNPGQEFSLTLALDRLEAALREKEERESQIQGTN
jgi:hypothetical protein